MPVQLKLADGSLWPHIGKLVVADNAVDPATGTLRVDAEFSNPGEFLRPGQFGRVLVTTENRKGAIVIPAKAITEIQGQARVAVVKNNVIAYRNVVLGARIGSIIVVESGLLQGEKIVIDGLQMIRDGAPVRTKPSAVSIDTLMSSN
jgi:membrane fusion protein (multidrug efflux system)